MSAPLPRRPMPGVEPDVAHFRAAFSKARRRRAWRAGLVGTTAMLVLVGGVGAASWQRRSADHSVGLTTQLREPTSEPQSGAAPAVPADAPSPAAVPVVTNPARSVAGTTSSTTVSASRARMDRSTTQPDTFDCIASDWCTSLAATRNKGTWIFAVTACPSTPVRPVALHFPRTIEADFKLYRDGEHVLWRWSTPFTNPTWSHSLANSSCWTWRTVWDGRDEHRHLVPKGRYVLAGLVYSDSVPDMRANGELLVP